MPSIKRDAYAKINLFLDIESKRDDGYHNIVSVMQSVSLHDTVHVEYTDDGEKSIKVTCDNPTIPTGEKNIAYKAANLFLDSGRVKIHIEKNIPSAAGLAGGSTDAAAVLLALNELCENKKSLPELLQIGAKIGADVPFCMVGGTKLTLGIGDKISDFTPMHDTNIVIACLGEGVSTPAAYSSLDKMNNDFSDYNYHKEQLSRLRKDTRDIGGMFNVFESAVIPERPAVEAVKRAMLECNAYFAMMSGSGPSVFGLFEDAEDAQNAVSTLKSLGASANICRVQGSF